jgi:hypothetical protein
MKLFQYVPWRKTSWVEVWLHCFLNLALYGCEWSDCLSWPLYGHRKSSVLHWVGGWLVAGTGLDVLDKRQFSYSTQDLNPRSSSIYPSYCAEHAVPYWLEGNTQVHINKMRGTQFYGQAQAKFWTEWQQVLPELILLSFPKSRSFSNFVTI